MNASGPDCEALRNASAVASPKMHPGGGNPHDRGHTHLWSGAGYSGRSTEGGKRAPCRLASRAATSGGAASPAAAEER